MEELFRAWLIARGYSAVGAASSYPSAILQISQHYSTETGRVTDIYAITDQATLSQIAHDYSQAGRFSEFGYQQHSRFRAAIARYSEFFVNHRVGDVVQEVHESVAIETTVATVNFSYEKDLQKTLCAQISDLFPGYRIYGEANLGIEYVISGKKIDVLLENTQNRELLIVELKSGRADFRVFGQISMYPGLAKREFPGREIRGAIVAAEIDDSLRYATETNPDIQLKIYRMSLELENA